MEYLIRKPERKNQNPKLPTGRDGAIQNPLPAESSMPGLLALGHALEAQGRGKVPSIENPPQVHVPPMDGV